MTQDNALYDRVLQNIAADLEKGNLTWRKPWNDPMAFCMTLHAGQSEDAPEEVRRRYKPLTDQSRRIEDIDRFFRQTNAVIVTGDRSGYAPDYDCIVIPPIECFEDIASYYAILAHELTHWTGHASRLCREFNSAAENPQSHAQEEIIAELGACFLAAVLGLEAITREIHAAYIQIYLEVLQNDKELLFRAAAQAREAVEYIKGLQPEAPREAPKPLPSPRPPARNP